MRIGKHILAVAVLAVGLSGQHAPPADAAVVSGSVFAGTATVSQGLWYPMSPNCGVALCPGASGSWTFSATGVGAVADSSIPAAGPATEAISGGGLFSDGVLPGGDGAWCGGGRLSGEVHWSKSILFGLFTTHGSAKIHISGIAAMGILKSMGLSGDLPTITPGPSSETNVLGLVTVLPPNPVVGGGSCLDGTATTFSVVGTAVIAG